MEVGLKFTYVDSKYVLSFNSDSIFKIIDGHHMPSIRLASTRKCCCRRT